MPAPHVEIGGWNVAGNYHCLDLSAPSEAAAHEAIEVRATIQHTFLDGSRIDLNVDGRCLQSQYHAARGDDVATARFQIQLPPGDHVLEVGQCQAKVTVKSVP